MPATGIIYRPPPVIGTEGSGTSDESTGTEPARAAESMVAGAIGNVTSEESTGPEGTSILAVSMVRAAGVGTESSGGAGCGSGSDVTNQTPTSPSPITRTA